jgi:DNA-3-methyladenine glycosylase
MHLLPPLFFEPDSPTVARALLGKIIKNGPCEGIIVEAEAYALDEASHALKKPNQGRLMHETYGHWYVYFTYGKHFCANVTCDKTGAGGVLIRAVEPTRGLEHMYERRKLSASADPRTLSSGPACVTQAFGITKADNGKILSQEFGIFDAPSIPEDVVVASPRIGIRAAVDLAWRFYIKDNEYVSKRPKN